MRTEADMIKKSARILDSILWDDSGDLIPQAKTTVGYEEERLKFCEKVLERMQEIYRERMEAHHAPLRPQFSIHHKE
jgi:hypothetical protein